MVTGNVKVAAKRVGGVHVSFPVPWPSRVVGVGGLKVTKANGVWTVQGDLGSLQDLSPPGAKWPTSLLWYFDAGSGNYYSMSVQELITIVGSGGGGAAPRVITAAGTVNVTTTDTMIILNKAAPSVTPIALPPGATRTTNLELKIVDYAGNGGDITITADGAEKIMGVNPWIVGSGGVAGSGGRISLQYNTDVPGWVLT